MAGVRDLLFPAGHGATLLRLRRISPTPRAPSPACAVALHVGSPDADDAANVHTYVSSAKRIIDRYAPLFLGFFVGDEDPNFVPENEQLHRELLEAKVPHAYAVYPGAHTGTFWAEHEQEWIEMADRRLR